MPKTWPPPHFTNQHKVKLKVLWCFDSYAVPFSTRSTCVSAVKVYFSLIVLKLTVSPWPLATASLTAVLWFGFRTPRIRPSSTAAVILAQPVWCIFPSPPVVSVFFKTLQTAALYIITPVLSLPMNLSNILAY